MDLLVQRYNTIDNIVWNNFNNTAKNGLFFFNRDFMDYHSDRFKDHSLIIYKKNKIVAIFPATQHDTEIVSHGGLTFGSLIMSFEIKASEVLSIFSEIKAYFRNQSCKRIIYKCIPAIFYKYPAEEDLYALYRQEAKLIRRDISSVIDLAIPIKFSETKRQLVRKCQLKEIKVCKNSDLPEYWQLLTQVLGKFASKPTHSLQEITYLREKFPEQIKLYTAEENDKTVAGIIIFDFGSVIHTQYMAASDQGRKIGALDYINSVLIEKYKTRKYYSFGISTENHGLILNEGLIQQKENMGARGVALDYYEITL